MADILSSPLFKSRSGMLPGTPAVAALSEDHFHQILDELPAAVYATDAQGRITYFNEAAVALWGHRPTLGTSEWCGSWKLFWPDGRPMPHDECPMAIAIKEQRPVRGLEGIAERPDGTRVPFEPYPTPLFDEAGNFAGAVNLLIDITDRKRADEARQRLATIVRFSDDAIISKNLDGIIESWNAGAERIFGYTADEAIGQSIEMLIPDDRRDEEPEIINRIRHGERMEHYETVRRRKDGSLIDVSLAVSPIMDGHGRVIAASKIARDITEHRRAQEQRELLLREMNHRIRNLFAVAGSVVALSTRSADTAEELSLIVRDRLDALARAHAMTLARRPGQATHPTQARATSLHDLIRTILSPYEDAGAGPRRITITGPDVPISADLVTDFALLLHEFATNAAKYGALSRVDGRIAVTCAEAGDRIVMTWVERGGPRIDAQPTEEGFGSYLARATITRRLGGDLVRKWDPAGLTIRLSVCRDRLLSPAAK